MSLPVLQLGDEGPSVSALQLALAALGFDPGAVDGVFGDTTATAVSQFQDAQGIPAGGVVDDTTWESLAGQPFEPGRPNQVNPQEFPSIARAIFFAGDVDAYLQDLGIDAASINDDQEPVG